MGGVIPKNSEPPNYKNRNRNLIPYLGVCLVLLGFSFNGINGENHMADGGDCPDKEPYSHNMYHKNYAEHPSCEFMTSSKDAAKKSQGQNQCPYAAASKIKMKGMLQP